MMLFVNKLKEERFAYFVPAPGRRQKVDGGYKRAWTRLSVVARLRVRADGVIVGVPEPEK